MKAGDGGFGCCWIYAGGCSLVEDANLVLILLWSDKGGSAMLCWELSVMVEDCSGELLGDVRFVAEAWWLSFCGNCGGWSDKVELIYLCR